MQWTADMLAVIYAHPVATGVYLTLIVVSRVLVVWLRRGSERKG